MRQWIKILDCGHLNNSYWEVLSVVFSFILPYVVVQTFESVGQILPCDHSNESYWEVTSACGCLLSMLYKMKFRIFFNFVVLLKANKLHKSIYANYGWLKTVSSYRYYGMSCFCLRCYELSASSDMCFIV